MMCTAATTAHTTIIRVYAPRARQFTDITEFSDSEMLSELTPVIVSYLRRYQPRLKVKQVTISERQHENVEFEVSTTEGLWFFKYRFEGTENWKVHKLQSSARLIFAQKM